ncbi:MAG TPA: transposase [Rhodanobacteraceae bacterium]|nr:transposase [Rhodanobacteraceae bacterium]
MPNYRRALVPGAVYFFTVVTCRRKPLLASPSAVQTLRESIATVRHILPFTINAWVVLPDHMHAIWVLPDGDSGYSTRWGRIKAEFTRCSGIQHISGRGLHADVWQPRFREHLIRNERDAAAHMDFLHFNPVKHGLVTRVQDWPYSSFHRYVREGLYPADWGGSEPAFPSTPIGE